MKQQIVMPLGTTDESAVNAEIANAITVYNNAVTVARSELANKLYKLPQSAAIKLLETVGNVEFLLPEYKIINSGKIATISDARAILGTDLITPDNLAGIFPGKDLNLPEYSDETQLPWTVQFIQNMKNSPEGCVIVYQPTIDKKTIDLKTFANLQLGIDAKGGGELLYRDQFAKNGKISDSAWFANGREMYCNQQIIAGGVWRISTKKPIAGTHNKGLVQQMHIVCLWLIELHKDCIVSEMLQSAIDEFRTKQNHLRELQNNNRQQFLREIQETKFWNYCMETGIETLFRLISVNQISGEKLLSGCYTRNSVTEPVIGEVGYSGSFYSCGSGLDALVADGGWGFLELVFSCTM
jgi:hypothetical protein